MTRPSWETTTETILTQAHGEDRTMLYEHEVYRILKALDVQVPVHCVIADVQEITADILRLFSSDRVVVKVISPHIVHKSTSGGVVVAHKDLDFIRYTFSKMIERHRREGIEVHGALLVEFIEYSQSLGNEILLGFRECDTFGAVISFSKGGDDADHFAGNFSSPNLIFPPIDKAWATALQQSTKIYSRYIEEDRTGFINHIVDAEMKFSRLATRFSSYFDSPAAFALTAFEVNPFVFTPDNRFIAIDGWASFCPRRTTAPRRCGSTAGLDAFFKPERIAVVGVSTSDDSKPANVIMDNLLSAGHNEVFGVNNRGGDVTIAGRKINLWVDLAAIRQRIDLAIVCVPAQASVEVIRQCVAAGVRAAILIPGGFSESTRDTSLEERMRDAVDDSGLRIIGPNCLGIISKGDSSRRGINTFFLSRRKFTLPITNRSNMALISQSGAFCVCVMSHLRHAVSPAYVVSYGNQLDVDAVDLISYFNEIDAIDVIGLYSEGFQPESGRSFLNAVSRSRKTVIVYKAGRTAEGRRAVRSHTASVAGEYEVTRAAIKQTGGIVAATIEDHVDYLKTFALLHGLQVCGTHIGIVVNAGFESACAADNLGTLVPATLTEATKGALKRILLPYMAEASLIDLTPMASDDQFADTIDILLGAEEIDALCISVVPQAEFISSTDGEIADTNNNLAARIVAICRSHQKPVVVSVNALPGADSVYNSFCAVLESGGIPTFPSADRAMASLNEFIHHTLIKEKRVLSEWLK